MAHRPIVETAAALVAQHGLRAVTMSQIAEETGIGRATLYKYFSGVEPILIAWHERHVAEHLEHLTQLRNQPGEPGPRLESVLHAYALISFERHQHGNELGALVHQGEHIAQPEQQLINSFRSSRAPSAPRRTPISGYQRLTFVNPPGNLPPLNWW